MSDEQIDREALAREVWSDEQIVELHADNAPMAAESALPEAAPQPGAEATPAPAEAVPPQESDPWSALPTALRQEIEAMRTKLNSTEQLETRLKQAERRLGSVQNELNAAKEAARAAPTPEQVAADAQVRRQWEQLQSGFPEIAEGTEARLTMERDEMRKLIPNGDVVKRQIAEEVQAARTEMAATIVALKHPDWRQIDESPEFKTWNESTGNRNSYNPIEVIAILDEFKAHQAKQQSPKQIEAERQQRLEQSQTPQGRRLPPVKTEADMSPAELRAHIAKQVWTEKR